MSKGGWRSVSGGVRSPPNHRVLPFFAIRRLLTERASNRPVVLVIDDLHWADSLLLDLIEQLVQWAAACPSSSLLALARLRDAFVAGDAWRLRLRGRQLDRHRPERRIEI